MTIKILQNTYVAAGYTLSAKYTGLTIESSASVGGTGVLATFSTTIEDYGNIRGNNTGVSLTKGGTVENWDQSQISGKVGVSIAGASGTVENYGGIYGNSNGQGIDFLDGGKVLNGNSIYLGARIDSGVYIEGGSGTVTNYGSINGNRNVDAVKLASGGAVANGSESDTFAFIANREIGVYSKALATVANFGTILSLTQIGVVLKAGGSVTNGTITDSRALIEGATAGLYVLGATGKVANFGTIVATGAAASSFGVILADGGSLTNGSVAEWAAEISGYNGVQSSSKTASATVTNFGTIQGVGGSAKATEGGVYLEGGGTVTNGTSTETRALISGSSAVSLYEKGSVFNFGALVGVTASAVVLDAGGSLNNGSTLDTVASIQGYYTGVASHAAATITNFGTIQGSGAAVFPGAGAGVGLGGGGVLSNGGATDTKAVIGGSTAVVVAKAAGTVTNFGTLHGETAANGYAGLNLGAGGKLTNGGVNDTLASVDGYSGVLAAGAAATIANFGTINGVGLTGQSGVSMLAGGALTNGAVNDAKAVIEGDTAVETSGVATVTNFGTIAGFGGVAVQFKSASDVLMVEAGSAFVGSVVGDHGELVLASGTGTMTGMLSTGQVMVSGSMAATTFSGFNTVEVGTGASFTVAGATTIAAGQSLISAGTLILSGTLNNVGTLAALGGTLTVDGAVTGVGGVAINGGIVDFASTITENVTFTGATGVLELDKSLSYAGAVTGLSKTGTNSLDLRDIDFISGTTKATYKGTTTSGELSVTDGTHTAFIELEGDYTTATFTVSTDNHGGTKVVDPSGPPGPHLAPRPPLHAFIQAASGFGGTGAGPIHLGSHAWRAPPPALYNPRGQMA